MIMFYCSSTSSQPRTLFLNKGFPKALSSAHGTNPSSAKAAKPEFTLPNWRTLSTSGKGLGCDRRTRKQQLYDAFFSLEHMVSKGHSPSSDQSAELIYDLCSFKELGKAVRALELTVAAKGRIFDSRVLAYLLNQHDNVEDAIELVKRLAERGSRPEAETLMLFVAAACKERGGHEAERLLEKIVGIGGRPGVLSYNALLMGFCEEGRLEDAKRLLRSFPSKGFRIRAVNYNILLRGLCYNGQWADAAELLVEMRSGGCFTDKKTYNILGSSLAMHGHTAAALEVLDDMRRMGLRPSTNTYNRIIAQLCKDGDVAAAKDCVNSMIHRHRLRPDGDTYNAVALLCHNRPGFMHEAFNILHTLCNHQNYATHNFYRRVVSQLCHEGNAFVAIQLLPEMVRVGFTPDSGTYSSIILGLCCDGMLYAALEVMGIMEEGVVSGAEISSSPTEDNYNALASGLSKARRMDLALSVYARMVKRGLMPSEITYSILVGGIAQESSKLAAEVLIELHRRNAVNETAVQLIAMEHDLEELVDRTLVGREDKPLFTTSRTRF